MLADDMFQQKINEIFKDHSNEYGIADDICSVGYDPDVRDHNKTLRQVIMEKTLQ